VEIYHGANGVPGYRMMRDLLRSYGFMHCAATIYKYMVELGLRSVVRRKKPGYKRGNANKTFPNLLNQNFDVDAPNKIWCTDFTYLYLADGTTRYNCTIIDLHDRIVLASLNGSQITASLAIEALKIAIKRHKPDKGLILHSDQGSQFTSKEFNDFCSNACIQQSMSRAGCPYDNAPMERYYNTLKNEHTNLFSFKSKENLDHSVNDFAYGWYNHVRPHTYNGGRTPAAARVA
jgi:putative transposase